MSAFNYTSFTEYSVQVTGVARRSEILTAKLRRSSAEPSFHTLSNDIRRGLLGIENAAGNKRESMRLFDDPVSKHAPHSLDRLYLDTLQGMNKPIGSARASPVIADLGLYT